MYKEIHYEKPAYAIVEAGKSYGLPSHAGDPGEPAL